MKNIVAENFSENTKETSENYYENTKLSSENDDTYVKIFFEERNKIVKKLKTDTFEQNRNQAQNSEKEPNCKIMAYVLEANHNTVEVEMNSNEIKYINFLLDEIDEILEDSSQGINSNSRSQLESLITKFIFKS